MKKYISLFLVCGLSLLLLARLEAQLIEAPLWEHSLSKEEWTTGDTIELRMRAKIDSGWYMYASDFSADLGPLRAELQLRPHDSYELVGELESVGRKVGYDSIFEGKYTYFSKEAILRQDIHIKAEPTQCAGYLSYQLCSRVTGQCVSFEEEISLGRFSTQEASQSEPSTSLSTEKSDSGGLWGFFFLAFFAGLAALLTPCVFPLIPMTVTYFTDHPGARSTALLYGAFIVLIYTFIGFVLSPFMGPELANELATGWVPNLLFFVVFLVFGLSFLGFFEISLPYRWANLSESKSEKGGWMSIFFMALTLVLVTFSCTGPIVGSILVESVGGLKMKPVVGMMGYSLAFALPFALFARFPKWLSALPKSGGWLNTVKVTLGFLELAFALKFLSIADQAYHWGILDREVYLSLWITIFGLLGMYLLGKLRLPKDSAVAYVGAGRILTAIACFSFVVYLVPGMFGAPLKALAGYLPPQSTHDFDLGERASRPLSRGEPPCGKPMYGDLLKFPHALQGYFDYEEALACARAEGKPLFVDFTGHGCVNCREMEARVWSDERVLMRLREDYILVALYVDEKSDLLEENRYISSYDNKEKRTIGQKNADFQITRFRNNAQPYYVLIGQKEELLLEPRAYDLEVEAFVEYLDKGKELYRSKYAMP